jgi:uncharacterized membrane protein
MTYVQRTLEQTETLERVNAPASTVQRWLQQALPDERRGVAALSGSWLGHPLHPVLVLVPIGAWVSVGLLDAIPGQQKAARKLVLAGLAGAVPAAIAGAADYRKLDEKQRRVGFVHLLANATASVCMAASYRARVRGRFLAGRTWALFGLAAVGIGGTLGGHLSYAQGVGVYRWQPERREQPDGQRAESAPSGEPSAREVPAGEPETPQEAVRRMAQQGSVPPPMAPGTGQP